MTIVVDRVENRRDEHDCKFSVEEKRNGKICFVDFTYSITKDMVSRYWIIYDVIPDLQHLRISHVEPQRCNL